MNIVLFPSLVRYVLAAACLVLGVATVLAVRRGRGGLGAALGVLALGSGSALAGEALVALTVRLAAPGASFNEYRWVFLSPWGRLGLALGSVAVILIFALAWRATRGASAWRRATMIILRTGAAVGCLVVFLEPAVELRQVAREPNRIAVLIDDSKSMGLAESPDGPTRIERTRRLLAASSKTLSEWGVNHHIDYYTFSDTLNPASFTALAANEARGKATLTRKALELVRARYEGRDLAGIILISDG
ncbi:MAG TPA: hypothetical protein VM513_01285, partial [Kofleriaceae bacterium]|nr:hypothetical protein [Kofleriaceae bacterium]